MPLTSTKTISVSKLTRFALRNFLFYFLVFSSCMVYGQIKSTGIIVNPGAVCIGGAMNLRALGYVMNPNSNVAFVDISLTGTDLPGDPLDDDSENNITLPFPFVYNGSTYATARVGNNGAMVFGSINGDVEFDNSCLPVSEDGIGGAGVAAVCVFWDDLLPHTWTTIKTQLVGTKYIIQWTDEDHYDVYIDSTITFQIQLEQTTNVITLAYKDVNVGDPDHNNGKTATIGLNFSETSSFEYSCNTPALVSGRSITYTPFSQIPTLSYSWTGPNGFTSSSPTPTIINSQIANSGLYAVTVSNGTGGNSSASATVTVRNCSGLPVHVKAFIQGYYRGSGKMSPVLQNQGIAGATDATVDTVTVQLHKTDPTGSDPTAFLNIIDSYKAIIDTGGNVTGVMTSAVAGSYYFLSISGRNFLLTVSSDSIQLSPTITNYDFTNSVNKAYGNNMNNNLDGTWSIYSGDISRDEYIATDDVTLINNDNVSGIFGYADTDISGDGYCGTDDVTMADNNNVLGIFSQHY